MVSAAYITEAAVSMWIVAAAAAADLEIVGRGAACGR